MKIIVGRATKEETQEIHLLFNKVEKINQILNQAPPAFAATSDRVIRIFFEAALNIKLDLEAKMQAWWDAIATKYSIAGNTAIDFDTGELYQESSKD